MANKSYSVGVTLRYNVQAPNEEKAQERADEVLEAILTGKPIKKSWFEDNLEADDAEVEEG